MSAERFAWVLLAALLLPAHAARSDVFLAGDIRLSPGEAPGSYELSASLPAGIAGNDPLEWPAGCTQISFQRAISSDRELLSYHATCERSPQRDDFIVTRWELDAARLLGGLVPASPTRTLLPAGGGIRIPFDADTADDRSIRQLAAEMLWQGMVHIWFGWDHLAFVLCLCMLARGLPLLGLVTAFTLGHSLSLGLAFFDVLRIAVPPTEALSALSIVLVAREALLTSEGAPGSRSIARAAVVVTIFGLVHGLGFASALGELGISTGERWPALLFFNLGVELGQIGFVAVVLTLMIVLRPVRLDGTARRFALYSAGIVGGYWLVERIATFSGA